MKRLIFLIIFNFMFIISLNAMVVPGTKFSGIIKRINKDERYIIIKTEKFYYPKKYEKILERYYRSKIKIIFTYKNKKSGKKYIIFIQEKRKNKRY